ncbi:MAG: VOC family protein [Thaumarchaeota archaeon]|nr:VOC family protein [Nitrososphaerota archaeon]
MPRVVYFNMTADDIEKAIRFYGDVFGWTFEKFGDGSMDYWLAKTGDDKEPGINGGLARKNPFNDGTVNTISVPSIEEYARKVVEGGGKASQGMPIKGVGYFAHCSDAEGNMFDMIQFDKNA